MCVMKYWLNAATAPAPELDTLCETLTRLKLEHAAAVLGTIMGDAVRDDLGHSVFLDRLLTAEAAAREERRIRTSLKLSGLPHGITLASFDFAFQPAVERRKIEPLATAQWIRDRQALLLLGPPGVGKSHLAAGLGVQPSSAASPSSSIALKNSPTIRVGMHACHRRTSSAGST